MDHWLDEDTEYRHSLKLFVDNFTGTSAILFSVPSEGPEGINNPQYLKHLSAFVEWLRQQDEVAHVVSLTDIIKTLNQKMHFDNEAFYKIPNSQPMTAQLLLMYEMSLPQGVDLRDSINITKSSTLIQALTQDIDSKTFNHLSAKSEHWIKENFPPYMHTIAAGEGVMLSHIREKNINALLTSVPLCFLLVGLLMMYYLKSWKTGLISLLPNLMPTLMAFGLWGFFVGEVGLSISVVGVISLGIIVDDTVHFLDKFTYARDKLELSTQEAIEYTFEAVGETIICTSLLLMAGFSVLTLSQYQLNSDMGALTAIVIGLALIVDFIFLPAFLLCLDRNKAIAHSRTAPSTICSDNAADSDQAAA